MALDFITPWALVGATGVLLAFTATGPVPSLEGFGGGEEAGLRPWGFDIKEWQVRRARGDLCHCSKKVQDG